MSCLENWRKLFLPDYQRILLKFSECYCNGFSKLLYLHCFIQLVCPVFGINTEVLYTECDLICAYLNLGTVTYLNGVK